MVGSQIHFMPYVYILPLYFRSFISSVTMVMETCTQWQHNPVQGWGGLSNSHMLKCQKCTKENNLNGQ